MLRCILYFHSQLSSPPLSPSSASHCLFGFSFSPKRRNFWHLAPFCCLPKVQHGWQSQSSSHAYSDSSRHFGNLSRVGNSRCFLMSATFLLAWSCEHVELAQMMDLGGLMIYSLVACGHPCWVGLGREPWQYRKRNGREEGGGGEPHDDGDSYISTENIWMWV